MSLVSATDRDSGAGPPGVFLATAAREISQSLVGVDTGVTLRADGIFKDRKRSGQKSAKAFRGNRSQPRPSGSRQGSEDASISSRKSEEVSMGPQKSAEVSSVAEEDGLLNGDVGSNMIIASGERKVAIVGGGLVSGMTSSPIRVNPRYARTVAEVPVAC